VSLRQRDAERPRRRARVRRVWRAVLLLLLLPVRRPRRCDLALRHVRRVPRLARVPLRHMRQVLVRVAEQRVPQLRRDWLARRVGSFRLCDLLDVREGPSYKEKSREKILGNKLHFPFLEGSRV
jgi:hypothetical protein